MIRLYPRLFSYLLVLTSLLLQNLASAQEDSKNIIIQEASDDIRFERTKDEQPVQVKESARTTYLCQDYRTSIPIATFYNDQVQIDEVKISLNDKRRHDITPKYEYFSSESYFFTDEHICHFQLPFNQKGDVSEVEFETTTLDPRYFSTVYFFEDYEIIKKTVTITVPSWLEVEVKEYNFKGFNIDIKKENQGDDLVYTYSIQNTAAWKKEANAPGASYLFPHLIVLVKNAKTRNGENYKYFKTPEDRYTWCHNLCKQVENDPAIIKQHTDALIQGKSTDIEKVKAIYQWVQHNIRYIAFEDGIAGLKPEKAQEVYRKKYGDCKGMANLLTQMLRSEGFDARLCWIGTNHIAYDHTVPSLCVDNHMICAWLHDGKIDFLDGTEKYVGFGEIAERIQGRDVMIEDGDKCLMEKVPVRNHIQNTSSEVRMLHVSGNDLVGHVVHTIKGENKEEFLYYLDHTNTENRQELLLKFLSGGNSSFVISNFKMPDLSDNNKDLVLEYDLVQKNALTAFGGEKYLDLDNRKVFENYLIDTAKKKQPFLIDFKDHMLLQAEIALPPGVKIKNLPPPLKIEHSGYQLTGSWIITEGKLSYQTESYFENTWVPLLEFSNFNTDIRKLRDFYSSQPSLIF